MNNLINLTFGNKKISLPVYFPDATRAVVRGLDFEDLNKVGIEGLVVNTYHLMTQPGATVIKANGGVKRLMNWQGIIASDSGGFQLLSLVYQDKSFGKITEKGVTFYKSSKNKKRKYDFTPERSIQIQFDLGADILICLDDCPVARAKPEEVETSVQRTIEWAKRSKEEYLKQIQLRKLGEVGRPKLFAVIQGGDDKKLREKCAQELLKIGFDGYGFGGWPLDKEGNLNKEILSFTSSLAPDNLPKFALGVGNPQAIVDSFKMGWTIFDCVLPTRDARHGRLYILAADPNANLLSIDSVYKHFYILDEKYVRDQRPISEYCGCFTCQNYSRSYLHHLFKIGDSLAGRLATIHNLRTYVLLIKNLRKYGF